MLAEIIWKNWQILGVMIIGSALTVYVLITRKASKTHNIHNAGIIMLIISLLGIYFGFFRGIVNQKISVSIGSRHSFDIAHFYGTDALIIGVLLTIASIAFLAFGIVAIRLSKNEENPNMDNSNKFQS